MLMADPESKKRKADADAEQEVAKRPKLDGDKPAKPPVEQIQNPESKIYPEDGKKGWRYYVPEGSESWLWDYCKLHTAVPGKFQCQIPLKEFKDGTKELCKEWLHYSSAGNLLNHASKTRKHTAWFSAHDPNNPENQQQPAHGEQGKARPTDRGRPGRTYFTAGAFSRFFLLMALWIGANCLPLSIVEGWGFKEMMRSICGQNVSIPTRNTILGQIHKFAEEVRAQIKTVLKVTGQAFSVTFDFWTTLSGKPMLGATAHYIDSDFNMHRIALAVREVNGEHNTATCYGALFEVLNGVRQDDSQIVGITGDNATTPVAVGRKAEEEKKCEVSLGCINHSLMLGLKDGEKASPQVTKAVAKIKAWVSWVHRSPRALHKYLTLCQEMGVPSLHPVQSVETRWNSILALLESVEKQRGAMLELLAWAVRQKLKTREQADALDCQAEWSIFDALLPALKAIRTVTKLFEGEKYPTVSRIVPALDHMYTKLEAALNGAGGNGAPADLFIRGLRDSLKRRLGNWTTPVLVSMLLDPAVRDLYMTADDSKRAWAALKQAYVEEKKRSPAPAAAPGSSNSSSSDDAAMDLYGPRRGPAADPTDEFERYQRRLPDDIHSSDPLQLWRGMMKEFPVLARLARRYLCIQPSSSSVERIFSTGGVIVNKKRCSLETDTMEDLILVHDNRDMLAHHLVPPAERPVDAGPAPGAAAAASAPPA